MPWYSYILLGIYVICCAILVAVVLLQSGKGDIASAFGGGGSQTAFGPRSAASTLSRVTMIAASLFMILSFVFTIPGVMTSGSVAYGIKDNPATTPTPSPAPGSPAPASPAPAVLPGATPATGQPATAPAATGEVKPATSPAPAATPTGENKPAEGSKPAENKPVDNKAPANQ